MYTRKVDYFNKHLSNTEINRMFHGMRQHNAYRFPNLMPLQSTRFKIHDKSSYLRKPASLNAAPIQGQSNHGSGSARLKARPKLRAASHSTITNHQVTRPRRLPRPPLLEFHHDTMAQLTEQEQPTPPPSPQNGNSASAPGKNLEIAKPQRVDMARGVEQQSKGPISIRLDDFYGPTASDNIRTLHYHAPPEYEWISDAEDEETTPTPSSTMKNNEIEVIDLTIPDSPGCPAQAMPPQRSADAGTSSKIQDQPIEETPLLKQLLAIKPPPLQPPPPPQPPRGRHQLYMGPYITPTQAERGSWSMRRNRSRPRPEIEKISPSISVGNKSLESPPEELTFQEAEVEDNAEDYRKDNAETHRVDNAETHRVENAETRRIDNAVTHRVDNAETHRVATTETHRVGTAETRRMDNAETHRVSNAETHGVSNAENIRVGNPSPILIENNTLESPPSNQVESSNEQLRHREREQSQNSLILPCIHAIEPNPIPCSYCNPRPQVATLSNNSETPNPINYWRIIPPKPMQLQIVSQRPVDPPLIVGGMFPLPAYLNPVSTITTYNITMLPVCIPAGINNGGLVLYTT